jgi:pyruvate,water dikinase
MPDVDIPYANVFIRIKNFINYLFILFSKDTAKLKIRELAKKLYFEETHQMEDTYNQLEQKMEKMHWALYYHYITSSYSGSMSSALHMTLDKDFKDKEELKAKIAGVLENIEEIESVDILRSMREIARALLQENHDIGSLSSEDLLLYLDHCHSKSRKAYLNFLERHGHRAIREAEMRSKSWNDDKMMLANYLKMVISTGGNEIETDKFQWRKQLEDLLKGYNPIKAMVIKYLINQARYGVKAREFSKSMIIKVIDQFKKEYRKLAKLLVNENLLSDEDCIFFLTHQEIGQLIKDKDISLNKKALARRKLLEVQKSFSFPEVTLGCPEPMTDYMVKSNSKVLKGIPVSRVIAFG